MLTFLDLSVIAIYGAVLMGVALYVSRAPADHEINSKDYFLAGNSLKWWAVGSSLIAANISAEQIIGQSGQGFVVAMKSKFVSRPCSSLTRKVKLSVPQ